MPRMMRDWTVVVSPQRTLSPPRGELAYRVAVEEFVKRELGVWVILTQRDARA